MSLRRCLSCLFIAAQMVTSLIMDFNHGLPFNHVLASFRLLDWSPLYWLKWTHGVGTKIPSHQEVQYILCWVLYVTGFSILTIEKNCNFSLFSSDLGTCTILHTRHLILDMCQLITSFYVFNISKWLILEIWKLIGWYSKSVNSWLAAQTFLPGCECAHVY